MSGIACLVLDIDGVLTDGKVSIDRRRKELFVRDLDAISRARREGLIVAFLSGEEDIEGVVGRCGGGESLAGCKDKGGGIAQLAARLGLGVDQVCYVGDADRDAEALKAVSLGLAPRDASPRAIEAANRVLGSPGGRGAVAEAVDLVIRLRRGGGLGDAVEDAVGSAARSFSAAADELRGMAPRLAAIGEIFVNAFERGAKLLLFGNGGSASMAQHAAAELVGRFRHDGAPLPAIALSADTAGLSALANDYGYEEVFARQVLAHARPGDVAIGFSTSGRSRNVLRALETAKDAGMVRIGFSGRDPSELARVCDHLFAAPSGDVPRIQELHLMAWHILCEALESARSSWSGLRKGSRG